MLSLKRNKIKDRSIRVIVIDDTMDRLSSDWLIHNALDCMSSRSFDQVNYAIEEIGEIGKQVLIDNNHSFVYLSDESNDLIRNNSARKGKDVQYDSRIAAFVYCDVDFIVVTFNEVRLLSEIYLFLTDNDLIDYERFYITYLSVEYGYDPKDVNLYIEKNVSQHAYLNVDVYLERDDRGYYLVSNINIDEMLYSRKDFNTISASDRYYTQGPFDYIGFHHQHSADNRKPDATWMI